MREVLRKQRAVPAAQRCRSLHTRLVPSATVEDQPTRVLDRTGRPSSPPRQGDGPPRGSGRPPGREPDFVYRRRRLAAGVAGGIVFLLLLIAIVSRGGDPEPKSTPSDLGVGGAPKITTPDTDRSKTNTETTGDSTATPAAPTTPPATGGTGGTVAPATPAQPEGTGGGAGQPAQPAPAPEDEGGGAAAPPGD